MTALFILMRRHLKGLDDMNIGHGLFQAALGTIIMSAVILGWLQLGSRYSIWIVAPIGIIAGGMIYVAIMFMLRVPELKELADAIRRRLIKNS
jgi:peptidoglycan biosynthesis protein MviN/MurJ (putative lipid II flippase)